MINTYLTIAYSVPAFLTFGYTTRRLDKDPSEERDSGWEGPLPILSGMFWPVVWAWFVVLKPISEVGWRLADWRVRKARLRLVEERRMRLEEEKVRIELSKIEDALTRELALEEEGGGLDARARRQNGS